MTTALPPSGAKKGGASAPKRKAAAKPKRPTQAKVVDVEPFLPDHRQQPDAVLLAPPTQGAFTPLTIFVCTYVARLAGLRIAPDELTRRMCEAPHGCLLAINSNYGHAAQPGHEHLLKAPQPPKEVPGQTRGRQRKLQGDGTCFNSAIEPVVAVAHPGIPAGKDYRVKCFPTTGETQVPGVLTADFGDGHAVLAAFVGYLNELGVGVDGAPVTVVSEGPNMLNYKFRLVRNAPRVLVNLYSLATYLRGLEAARLVARPGAEPPALTAEQAAAFDAWPALLLPPYPVRETKAPTDDVKVSFRFEIGARGPRVNVFQGGKINILGAKSAEAACAVYDYLCALFTVNWSAFVCLQPRRDAERAVFDRLAAATHEASAALGRLASASLATTAALGQLADAARASAAHARAEAEVAQAEATHTEALAVRAPGNSALVAAGNSALVAADSSALAAADRPALVAADSSALVAADGPALVAARGMTDADIDALWGAADAASEPAATGTSLFERLMADADEFGEYGSPGEYSSGAD